MENFSLELINKAEPLFHTIRLTNISLWSTNLTNMPSKLGSLMTGVPARRLFPKQERSLATLTPPPWELQCQIPSTTQRDTRWMNFTPARSERSVPSGMSSSSEAQARRSKTVTALRCREHEDSGADSDNKWAHRDPHLTRGCQGYRSILSGSVRDITAQRELRAATAMLPKPNISWCWAGSTRAALDLNNESHSWSSCVHLKMNKRETGYQPEINVPCFASYWKSLTSIN